MRGHNTDLIVWALANGATSSQLNTALAQVALANGATATDLNTATRQFLEAKGYTGALPDMWAAFVLAGMPMAPAGQATMTVEQNAALKRGYDASVVPGTYQPGTLSPTALDYDDSTITELSVTSAGAVVLETDSGTDYTGVTLHLTINDYLDGGVTAILTGGVGGTFTGTASSLYTFFGSWSGDLVVSVVEPATSSEHIWYPMQNTATWRGFDGPTASGPTYYPGDVDPLYTGVIGETLEHFRVKSDGDVSLDVANGAPKDTPSLDVAVEGWGTVTLPWVSAAGNWSVSNTHPSLYTFLASYINGGERTITITRT